MDHVIAARAQMGTSLAFHIVFAARVAVVTAMLLGIVVILLVARHGDTLARAAVGAEALAVLAGWFRAQAPSLVPGHWTLEAAAASPAMLQAFLIAAACGAIVLIPSLALLFAVFKGPAPSR